jgi:hypothetical protein
VAVCAGCFPATKQGWFTGANMRGEGLCTWKNVRWNDNGVLLAPETGAPMARGHVVWGSGNAWHGATVHGELKKAGPFFLLQGTWRGDGIVLDADVDVSGAPVFSAFATARAGKAGLLPRGADVVVVEASSGHLVVMPPDEAMREFMPAERPVAEMACEALTLYPQDADALEWSGLDKAAPRMELSLPADLLMRETPGGAVVGHFHQRAEPLLVRRLEVQGEWARIAYVTDAHVVWHGWVPAASVVPEKDDGTIGLGGLVGGLLGSQDQGGWSACTVEQKLYARVQDRMVHVGRVLAATPFRRGVVDGRYVSVTLRASWLEPEPGVSFFLEAGALSCGPWIAPPPPPPPAPKTL